LLFGNAIFEFEPLLLASELGKILAQLLFGDAVFKRQLLLLLLQLPKGAVRVRLSDGSRRQPDAQERDTNPCD
jgi:hypothetical protein